MLSAASRNSISQTCSLCTLLVLTTRVVQHPARMAAQRSLTGGTLHTSSVWDNLHAPRNVTVLSQAGSALKDYRNMCPVHKVEAKKGAIGRRGCLMSSYLMRKTKVTQMSLSSQTEVFLVWAASSFQE